MTDTNLLTTDAVEGIATCDRYGHVITETFDLDLVELSPEDIDEELIEDCLVAV